MYIETWYKVHCPKCGKANWINNGDTTDLTDSDVEGVECWGKKCCHKFELWDDLYEEGRHEFYYEKGLRKPN